MFPKVNHVCVKKRITLTAGGQYTYNLSYNTPDSQGLDHLKQLTIQKNKWLISELDSSPKFRCSFRKLGHPDLLKTLPTFPLNTGKLTRSSKCSQKIQLRTSPPPLPPTHTSTFRCGCMRSSDCLKTSSPLTPGKLTKRAPL